MHDPIADMLIRIKNAGNAGRDTVSFPYSKIKHAIAEVLQKNGFIGAISKKGKKIIRSIDVELVYQNDRPRITDVKRVSKYSRRIYRGVQEVYPVKQGHGMSVLSTSKGIMTGVEARKAKVGGELLFEIW